VLGVVHRVSGEPQFYEKPDQFVMLIAIVIGAYVVVWVLAIKKQDYAIQ
jgi:hypothetical protein